MSKEVVASLSKYLDSMKSKLSDSNVPEKHKNRVASYHQFLNREIEATEKKIELVKMYSTPESKR